MTTNTPRPGHDPEVPSPVSESDWAAQESALAHRCDAAPRPNEDDRYRQLARVIASWPEPPMPDDLASSAVRIVEGSLARERARGEALNGRIERTLLGALMGVFAIACGVVFLREGLAWLVELAAGAPMLDSWMVLLVACAAVTRAPELWQRLRGLDASAALAD